MPLTIHAHGVSDVGTVRLHNEDSYLVDPELGLYIVADGMGGHERGEVASHLACRVIHEELSELPQDAPESEIAASLGRAVEVACRQIHEASQTMGASHTGGMGTTLDAVLVHGTTAFTAHVGDGRIYLLRDAQAHRLTVDHSLVQEQIDAGIISAAQARRSPRRNIITRALGPFAAVEVDLLHLDIQPGDRLLLCSDGLYGRLEEAEIAATATLPAEDGAAALVDRSNERGTRDNTTALVVAVEATGTPTAAHVHQASTEQLETLRQCELFSACTYREIVQVAAACEVRAHTAGADIFREGERGREFFIVIRGRVALQRQARTLAQIGPAGFFGELSFLDHPDRSATATCLSDTRLLVLSRRAFTGMLRQESALANKLLWSLLTHLAELVRRGNERLLAQDSP